MENVLIIIVSYNGANYLERLLISIKRFENSASIIVIDNNSRDNSVAILEKFHDIKVIELDNNIGFGAANNIGLKYAIDNAFDYVFLLNQDTYLTKSIFEELIRFSNLKNNNCLLSPLQMNGNNTKLESSFEKFLYQSGYISHKIVNPNVELYKINFIQAASWFLPIETIKLVGGFDPIFFHYGEDNNYCQRLEYFNIPVIVVQSVSICHDSNPYNENYSKNYGKYHLNRLKCNYLIKYANINTDIKLKSSILVFLELIINGFRFLLKLKLNRFFGLFEYSVFQIIIKKSITTSKHTNKTKGMHYLN